AVEPAEQRVSPAAASCCSSRSWTILLKFGERGGSSVAREASPARAKGYTISPDARSGTFVRPRRQPRVEVGRATRACQ
ncbi:hypothetical protein RTBOTA2_000369, partial [Rhodotorula toruloides]